MDAMEKLRFHSRNGAGAPDSRPRFIFPRFYVGIAGKVSIAGRLLARGPLRVFFLRVFCL